MGYFANGTEGEAYVHRYCRYCRNYGDGKYEEGCAVMDLHLSFNYAQCKDGLSDQGDFGVTHGPTVAIVLDGLIPRLGAVNGECLMFRAREDAAMEAAGQVSLLEYLDAQHGTHHK